MAKNALPTPSELRQLLRYDTETGKLHWLARPLRLFNDGRAMKVWNTRYSGKEAGSLAAVGYVYCAIHNRPMLAHRVIWAMVTGRWPEYQIDHINGDRADNRITNLRAVSRLQNQQNMSLRVDNKTGTTGVFKTRSGKYLASIGTPPNLCRLGLFDSIEGAVEARKSAEIRMGYHPNHGRKVVAANA